MCTERPPKPGILVYNHVTGNGHHDSWNAMFIALLMRSGYHVYSLTPDPEVLRAILTAQEALPSENLTLLPWGEDPRIGLRQRLGQKIRSGVKHLRTSRSLAATTDAAPAQDTAPSSANSEAPSALRVLVKALHSATMPYLRAVMEWVFGPLWTQEEKKWLHRVQGALRQLPVQPDFLFLMYVDALFHFPVLRLSRPDIPLPWGGICFSHDVFLNGTTHRLPIFADDTFRGLCLLDDVAEAACRNLLPQRVFQHIPDIADDSLPGTDTALATDLRSRAGDRPIVLLIGSIDARKNIYNFCRVAGLADPAQWFFAVVGLFHLDTLPAPERKAVEAFIAAPPENVFIHSGFLPREEDLNAVIVASDILFAVYKNFCKSSNMLHKAALFRKPLVVSKGELMGHSVTKYGIGMTADSNSPQCMLKALERVRESKPQDAAYYLFMHDNSMLLLQKRLVAFIATCSNKNARFC